MRIWTYWIGPGLAAVGCLTALVIWFEAASVETDLRLRATETLRQAHPWAKVSLNGRDLTLTGVAPDESSRISALGIARQTYGVRVAVDKSTLLPEEKPYRLTIEKTAEGVLLTGFVPNEAARANLVALLTGMLPGIALSDQMRLARGAPADLLVLAGYGLSAFPRFSTGAVEITDRTITIRGQALNPEDHEIALAAVAAIPWSAGEVSSVAISPATASGDYTWSASIGPEGLMLEGYAPDAATRAAIADRARAIAPGLAVEDRMRFASGVPEGVDWQAQAEEALSIVPELSEGTAVVRGRVLDLTGQAVDGDAFQRVQATLSAGLKSGLVLGTADIGVAERPAFEWTARRGADALVLTGGVSGEAFRARLLESAGLKFGHLEIEDTQEVAAGAPEGFEAAALAALQALSRLDDGQARIAGRTVHVQGSALSAAAAQDVARLLSQGLPEGFSAEPEIEVAAVPDGVLAAEACQAELDRLAVQNTVLFETGAASIRDHSYGFLDRIAFAARQCGQARLEISGHTDSDGSEADNLALSQRRAEAVLDFMIAAGVPAERMDATGYGESRPVASNDTDAGKAANRRIEFRVLD
ncbi:MAG: OmpA family protein [Hoeflea sp.]|uniref:OmpA family protein n=1 Tax=Hoeflea sp. TaxID=1940281 RepID=UPI002731CB7D|nr:OmpA family protein [Hoeflea sp.]MDP2118770.1 OmpA family protein [Hoeflea sp.]